MITRIEPTVVVDVYVSGDYTSIKHCLSKFCLEGLCVSVSPVDYVYTYGLEAGAKVTLINYPRYPTTQVDLIKTAKRLGLSILGYTAQGSFTVVGPDETYFYSNRSQDE